MRANFAFSALTATALMCVATASTAALTVTPSTPALSGVTAAGDPYSFSGGGPSVIFAETSATTTMALLTEVVTAPTTTTSGLAYLYEVTTVNTVLNSHVASWDYFSWEQGLTANSAGAEYLTFSATVTASQATTGYFGIYSSGSYTALASPFGASVPALPSYYYRLDGSSTWTLAGSSNTTTASSTFSGGEWISLALAAGTSTTLEIAVFAGSNVDLSSVGLTLYTDYYDEHVETTDLGATTTKTLLSAQLLAPVPEPQTYALVLAGLLFVGLKLRGKR